MESDIDISKIRRLDGGLLLVFRELLRHTSVTRAAESLSLSQSAVSHALGRLRALFEDPLFLRLPHGLQPTRRAEELAPHVEALIELSARTLGMGRSFDPGSATRLFRLSAPEFVVIAIGATLSRDLAASAPGVHYAIEHLEPQAAFEDLRQGRLDLALGRFDDASPQDLLVEPLYEDAYCVVARRAHPRFRRSVSASAYRDARHVFAESTSELTPRDRNTDYAAFRGVGTVPRWLAALIIVAQTDGIATCPRRLADSMSELLDLRLFEPPFATDPIRVSMARRRAHNDPASSWFAERVRSAFA